MPPEVHRVHKDAIDPALAHEVQKRVFRDGFSFHRLDSTPEPHAKILNTHSILIPDLLPYHFVCTVLPGDLHSKKTPQIIKESDHRYSLAVPYGKGEYARFLTVKFDFGFPSRSGYSEIPHMIDSSSKPFVTFEPEADRVASWFYVQNIQALVLTPGVAIEKDDSLSSVHILTTPLSLFAGSNHTG